LHLEGEFDELAEALGRHQPERSREPFPEQQATVAGQQRMNERVDQIDQTVPQERLSL
jgi:hypothetical protein